MEIKIDITCSCGSKSVVQLFSDQKEYVCEACGTELFKAHISNGYVYVLSNPSMPNLLKIGYTERDVDERVEELNSTGVPVPFEIEAIFGSPNAYDDEQAIHNILDHHRLANNREFFSIDTKEAVQCIIDYIGSEPSFLKSPELLMSDDEKRAYQDKIRANLLDHITQYESLRNKYLNMATQEDREIWNAVADSFFEEKPHLTESQREVYTRWSVNNFLVDHFSENSSDKRDMEEWLSDLEFYRQEYYGCDSLTDFINE
jgi:hypothetical protein